MTTTIKVHVNGSYKTTIKQTNVDGSTVEHTISGAKKGDGDEVSLSLPHPASATFAISEEQLPPASATEGA